MPNDLHEGSPEVMRLAADADTCAATALRWLTGRAVRGPQGRKLAAAATEDQRRARRVRLEELEAALRELFAEGEVPS